MKAVKSLAGSLSRSPSALRRKSRKQPDGSAVERPPGLRLGVAVLPTAAHDRWSPPAEGEAASGDPKARAGAGEAEVAVEPRPGAVTAVAAPAGAPPLAESGAGEGEGEGDGGGSAGRPPGELEEAEVGDDRASSGIDVGGAGADEGAESEPMDTEWQAEAPPAWIEAGAALAMLQVTWEAAEAAEVLSQAASQAPPGVSGSTFAVRLRAAVDEVLLSEGLSRADFAVGGRARLFAIWVLGRPQPPGVAGGLEEDIRASLDGCDLSHVRTFTLLRGSPADFTLSPQGVEAWAQGLRVLNLQDCGLAVLPQALTALGALEELNLARNCLQALPVDVSFLSNLRVLSAERNQIGQFVPSLQCLPRLQTLNLEHNRLVRLRNDFSQEAPALKELLLIGNPLEALPQIMGCAHIENLSFGNARIEAVTEEGDQQKGGLLLAKVTVLPAEGLLGSVAGVVSRAGGDQHSLVLDLAFRGGDPHPLVLAAVTAIARGGKGDCEKVVHREGAVQQLLLSALHSSHDLVVGQACECLQVLADGMEDGGKELLEKGLQDSLCALLQTPDSHRCGLALPLACSLAFRGDEIPEWLVSSGIVESLLSICRNDESVKNQIAALQCLGNLAFCAEARRIMLKSPGLVQALERMASGEGRASDGAHPERSERLADKKRRKAVRALASIGANGAVDRAVGRAPRHRRGVRILALDGGGLRSLATCMLIAEIEQRTGKKIYELFDLIGGVSAGAFSACGMGILKMRSNQVEWICRYMGTRIFQKPVAKSSDRSSAGPVGVGSFLSEAVSTLVAAGKQTARTAVFGTKYPVDALETYLKTYATVHGELKPPANVTVEQMVGSFRDHSVLPGPDGPDLGSDEEKDDPYETFLDGEERGGCRVCLVGTRIDTHPHQTYVFRSYNHPEPGAGDAPPAGRSGGGREGGPAPLPGSCKPRMWEACRASSAAPYFLEECNIDGKRFVDGAFVSNNPSMVAMAEAQRLWPDRPVEVLVSLGTGIPATRPKGPPSSKGGPLGPTLELLTVLMNSACSADKVHTALQLFTPSVQGLQYFRFQVADERCDMKLDCTDPEKLEALLAAFTEYAGTHEHELQDACDALLRAEEKDRGGGAAPVQGGGGLSGVLVVDAPEPGAGAVEGVSPAEDPGSPGPGSAAGAACPSASAGRRLVERLGESLPLCPIQHWKAHKRRPPGASSAPSVTDPSAGGGGPGAEEPPAAQVLRQLRALRAGGGAGEVCALHLAGSGLGDGFVLDWTCDALAVAEPSEEAAELLRTVSKSREGVGPGTAPGRAEPRSLAELCDRNPVFPCPGGGSLSLKGRNAQKVGELAVTTLLFERVRPRAVLDPSSLRCGGGTEFGAAAGAEGSGDGSSGKGGGSGVVVTSGAPLPAALVRALLNAGALAVVLPGECVPRVADLPGFFTAFYGELHRLLALPLEALPARPPKKRPPGQVVREALRAAGGLVPALARAFACVEPPRQAGGPSGAAAAGGGGAGSGRFRSSTQ